MGDIFISHSSRDAAAAALLHERLRAAGFGAVFLDFDPDDGIPAGRDWEHELYARLSACRAVIVLCSPDSMASRWCFFEIAHARALGKALFPVVVARCDVPGILRDRQVVALAEGDGDEGFQRLLYGLVRAGLDRSGALPFHADRPPWPGLLSFDEADAAVFFGREREVQLGREALERFARLGAPARLLLVLGASGSGKSSLLRAGIGPRLRLEKDRWVVVPPFRPGARPFEAAAAALSAAFRAYGVDASTAAVAQRLDASADATGTAAALEEIGGELRKAAGAPFARVLLPVDQLEEALTGGEGGADGRFLGALLRAVEAPDGCLVVAATLRSDFLEALQRHPALAASRFETLSLGALPDDRVAEIVEGPARRADVVVGPGLVAALERDTTTEAALPLLAFALRELWERASARAQRPVELRLEDYRDGLGRLKGSLARAAQRALPGQLTRDQEKALREALLKLVRLDDAGRPVRQPAPYEDLPEEERRLVDRLVAARLLVSRDDPAGGPPLVEVAHEALFHVWPLLQRWVTADHAFLVWRGARKHDLDAWKDHPDRLLRGPELREAETWRQRCGNLLIADERAFIAASAAAATRRKAAWIAVTAVVVLTLAVLAVLALVAERHAESARRAAVAQDLAATARSTVGTHPERSVLLAVEAIERAAAEVGRRVPVAEETVRLGLHRLRGVPFAVPDPPPPEAVVAFGPGGDVVVAVSPGQAPRVWERSSNGFGPPAALPPLPAGTDVKALAVDRTGEHIVAAAGGKLFRHDRCAPDAGWAALPPAEGTVAPLAVALARGGARLLMADDDGNVRLRDAPGTAGERVFTLCAGPRGCPFRSGDLPVALSEDGRWAAAGDSVGAVRVWDLLSLDTTTDAWPGATFPPPTRVLRKAGARARTVAVSPDGAWVVAGLYDRTLFLSEAAPSSFDGLEKPTFLRSHDTPVKAAAVSAGGCDVLSAPERGPWRRWTRGRAAVDRVDLHLPAGGYADAVVFSPEGGFVIAAPRKGEASVVPLRHDAALLADPKLPRTKTRPAERITSLAVSAVRQRVVGVGSSGRICAWDARDARLACGSCRHAAVCTPKKQKKIHTVAVSPDGAYVATGGSDRTLRRWPFAACFTQRGPTARCTSRDLATEDHPELGRGQVQAAAFAPDSRRIAAGYAYGAFVWDPAPAGGRAVQRLPGYGGVVSAIAWAPDGRILAGCADGRLRIWRAPTEAPFEAPTADPRPIRSVALSADGRWLVTGSAEELIRVWDLAEDPEGWRPVALQGVDGVVRDVAVSPDGRWVAAATRAGVQRWQLRIDGPGVARDLVCPVVGRDLAPDEWRSFLGAEAYRAPCGGPLEAWAAALRIP